MNPGQRFEALREAIVAELPDDPVTTASLDPALAELARALAAEDVAAAELALDLIEDLLEARVHKAGWPSASSAPARGGPR